jgi:hypothetical protein
MGYASNHDGLQPLVRVWVARGNSAMAGESRYLTSPRYPPSTVRPACELKAPIARTKNVMVNRMNTTSSGRLKVMAATVI